MRIDTTTKVEAFTIYDDSSRLDPVLVLLQDFGAGRGRFIVECYGDVWTTYWGAMGDDQSLKGFILGCGNDYIVNRMFGQHHKRNKSATAYLTRIIESVKAALQELQPVGKNG